MSGTSTVDSTKEGGPGFHVLPIEHNISTIVIDMLSRTQVQMRFQMGTEHMSDWPGFQIRKALPFASLYFFSDAFDRISPHPLTLEHWCHISA